MIREFHLQRLCSDIRLHPVLLFQADLEPSAAGFLDRLPDLGWHGLMRCWVVIRAEEVGGRHAGLVDPPEPSLAVGHRVGALKDRLVGRTVAHFESLQEVAARAFRKRLQRKSKQDEAKQEDGESQHKASHQFWGAPKPVQCLLNAHAAQPEAGAAGLDVICAFRPARHLDLAFAFAYVPGSRLLALCLVKC